MNKVLSSVSNTIKTYYLEHFCPTLHSFEINKIIGAILILFSFYWNISFLISEQCVKMMQKLDHNIPNLRSISFLRPNFNSTHIIYAGLAINFSMLTCFIIDGVLFTYSQKLSNFFKNFHKKMQLYISFIGQIYNYVIFIPIVYHTLLKYDQYYISCISFISCILLSTVINLHNQSYSFSSQLYLGFRTPFVWQFCLLFLYFINCIFLAFVEEITGLLIVNFMQGLYQLIYLLFGKFVNKIHTLFWMVFFSFLYLFFTLIIFISDVHNSDISIVLLALIVIPTSYSITNIIYKYDLDFEILKQTRDRYNPKKDFLIRQLLIFSKLDYEDYKISSLSQFHETISLDHIINCTQYPKCFCFDIVNQSDQYKYEEFQQSVLSGRLRQKFLQQFIYELFKSFCGNKRALKSSSYTIDAYLSFINYLIDVKKSKVQVFCELVKLSSKQNISLRERALLQETYKKAQKKFENITIAQTQLHAKKVNKEQQQNVVYEKTKGTSKKSFVSVELRDYLCGIKFDEGLNQLEELYLKCLTQKENILKMLSNDFINLKEFKEKAIEYYKRRQLLQDTLKGLSKIHYGSQKLQFFMDRYVQVMAFGQRKKDIFKNYKKNKSYLNEFDSDSSNVLQKMFNKVDQKIFDKDNCVIFITLIDDIGTIKRSQSKFEPIFGYSLKEALGKNISIILPNQIAPFHNAILQDFVDEQLQEDEGQNNIKNKYSNSKSFLLAKSYDGWAVPISIVFKTDNIGLEECGLTTHIIKLKSDSAFVMTSVQQFQVQLISEILFDRLFNRFVSNQSDLRRIYLNKMIPLLHYFENQFKKKKEATDSDMHLDFVKTIAFLPKYDYKMNSFKTNSLSTTNTFGLFNTRKKRPFIFEAMEQSQLDNEIKNYSLDNMDIFSVQVKFSQTTNKYFSYNVVELASFRKLIDNSEIKECLQTFTDMMKSLLQVSFPFQREIAKLDGMNNSQNQFQSINHQESSVQIQQRAKIPHSILEEINDRSELKQEDEQESEQKRNDGKNILQTDEKNQEQNEDKIPKENNIYLDKKKLKLEAKDYSSQQINSSRMDLDVHNNQSYVNSSSNLFDQSHYFDQQHNKSQKNFSITQLQNNEKKNYSKISTNQENNNNSPDNLNSNQYVQTLQSLHKITVKDFDKTEDLNHFSAKDSTQYYTEQQTNAQNINTTEKFFDAQIQSQDQGKLEKMLFEKKNSFQESQIDKQKSQNQVQNPKNMQTSLQLKSNEKRFSHDSNHLISAKQIGVNKHQEEFISRLNQRLQDQMILKKTGTLYSKNFENNLAQQTSSYEKKDSRLQKDLNYFQNQQIYEYEFEGEDILKKRQNQNGNGSYSSSDDYYYKYEKKKSNLVATSSIHTSKTHNYEQKRNLKTSIASKRKNFLMISLTLFGLCSVSVVIALTLFQYFNIINQFSLAQTCFQFLPWPMSIRGSYVIIMQQESIISLIEHDAFEGIQDNNYLETSYQTLRNAAKNQLSLFQQYQNSDQTRMTFFKYLSNNQMKFITSIDDLISTNPQTYNQNEKDSRTVTVGYYIQATSGYFNQIISDLSIFLYFQKIQTDNFLEFNTHLVELQTNIENDASDIINSIQEQVLILLILVIVLAVLLIGAIFPIYYFVQIQNELVLKLFATIQPDHLKAMMIPIQLAQTEEKSSKFKLLPDNFKKKKTISSTSVLPKFKPVFIIYCLISFGILIIQPVTNYALSKQFQQATFLNIDLLLNLYDLKANFISSVAIFFSVIGQEMNIGIKLYNENYYQTRMTQLINTNQQKLNQMYSTINNSYAQTRYQQYYYDDFLYKIIQDDMCSAFQAYPQFISQEDQIDQNVCKTIYNGSLQKGFEFSVKLFLQTFENLHQIIDNKADFQKNIIQWEKENKIQDFNKFFNILYSTINIMRDFMLQMMKDQLDMMVQIQTILLLFQLFALSFVFLVGWVKFYNYVNEEMYLVKNLISIISIEVVLENPYIMSYLNQ